MHECRATVGARDGEVRHGFDVHGVGSLLLRLGAIHGGVGGAVDHCLGLPSLYRAGHGIGVGDVEIVAAEADGLEVIRAEIDEFRSSLAGGAGDEDFHRSEPR